VMPRSMPRFVSIMDLYANADSTQPDSSVVSALGATPPPVRAVDYSAGILELPRPAYNSLQGAHGKIDAYLQFDEYVSAPVANLPLRPGSSAFGNGQSWRLRSIFLLPQGTTVLAIDYRYLKPGWSQYVLVNKVRREFSLSDSASDLGSIRSDFVSRSSSQFEFRRTWSLDSPDRRPGIDEAWLAQAELEVLTEKIVARPVIRFRWDDIVLPTSPAKN
jgi:hypothetical protein